LQFFFLLASLSSEDRERRKSSNRFPRENSGASYNTVTRSQDQLTAEQTQLIYSEGGEQFTRQRTWSEQQLTDGRQQLADSKEQLTGGRQQLTGVGQRPTRSDQQLARLSKQAYGSRKQLTGAASHRQLAGSEKHLVWDERQLPESAGGLMLPKQPRFTTAFQVDGSLETEIL
jgi:hypothetical protein